MPESHLEPFGLQHQPAMLRSNPKLIENVHFQVKGGVAYFLRDKNLGKNNTEETL